MTIPTTKTPPKLSEHTAKFVEACHVLKTAAPQAWLNFFAAYSELLDVEVNKLLKERPDPNYLLHAHGRTAFADTLGTTMDNCTQLFIAHRSQLEAQAKAERLKTQHDKKGLI